MKRPHSHPAHRLPPEPTILDPGNEFEAAAEIIADSSCTTETPGVHPDPISDELIRLARQWLERQRRSREWTLDLGALTD